MSPRFLAHEPASRQVEILTWATQHLIPLHHPAPPFLCLQTPQWNPRRDASIFMSNNRRDLFLFVQNNRSWDSFLLPACATSRTGSSSGQLQRGYLVYSQHTVSELTEECSSPSPWTMYSPTGKREPVTRMFLDQPRLSLPPACHRCCDVRKHNE